jgi:hypothetical protein
MLHYQAFDLPYVSIYIPPRAQTALPIFTDLPQLVQGLLTLHLTQQLTSQDREILAGINLSPGGC